MAQMTLRLSADHERMLDDLQRRNPGVSRQKLFEALLEESTHARDEEIATIAERVAASNPTLWEALRSR